MCRTTSSPWWPVLVVMVTCVTVVVAPRTTTSGDVRGRTTASADVRTRKVLRHWCHECPPGKEQISYCTQTHPTQCKNCQPGFYSTAHDRLPCRPCSVCAPQQIRIRQCTQMRDTQCVDKDAWADQDWVKMRLMDTDVIDDHDDMMDADEDDDVASSLGSSAIKDEIDGIDSVDSSYFNKRLSDLEPPQGPPVKQDSQYASGVYRRRGTLGVDSSEVQGQPQPSQTIDDGIRGHSRQKRQTTTTMRTNSVPVVGSTASPHAHAPQSQGQENTDSERTNGTWNILNPSVVGPDPGTAGFPNPEIQTEAPNDNLGPGAGRRPPANNGGHPPGWDPEETDSSDADPGPSVIHPQSGPDQETDGVHRKIPSGGRGGKNWDSEKSGTSNTGHLNDIVTYVVIGAIVMVTAGAAAGAIARRGYIFKRRTQHAGESCATYDNKDDNGVSILMRPVEKSLPDELTYLDEVDPGYKDKKGSSLDSVKFIGPVDFRLGGTKVPNARIQPSRTRIHTPSGLYDNVIQPGGGVGLPVDQFSWECERVLEEEGGGNPKLPSNYGDSSRGLLTTDGGRPPGATTSEFMNPLFTGSDLETDGPGPSPNHRRPSPVPSIGSSSSSNNQSPGSGGHVMTPRASPAPSVGSSVSSGINSSNRSSVLDSLAKDMVKPSNVNFNTVHPSHSHPHPNPNDQHGLYHPHSHPQHPHPQGGGGYRMSDGDCGFGGLFDQCGGRLRSEGSAVSLRIPRRAIPPDKTYAVRGYIHLDLQPFLRHIHWEDGECMISPVPEYQVVDGHSFNKLVQIRIPHCLDEQELMPYIRVQHGDLGNNRPFQDVPLQAKENNIRQDIYYTVEDNYINIYTSHFTQFICSCKKPYNLQLEAMLFGSYSCLGEQEVKLRLYLCDALFHKVEDFRQDLIKREKHKLLESSSVALPSEGLSAQSEVDMELRSKDADWQPQTICGLQVADLKQTKKIGDLVCCHASRYEAPVAADFVMVPAPKADKKTFFKGAAFITPRITSNTPTKQQKKKKFGFIGGKNKKEKDSEKDSDKPEECKQTIIWFGFSFGYEAQRSQNGLTEERSSGEEEEEDDLDEETLQVFEFVANHLPRNEILPLSRKLGIEQTVMEDIEYSYRNSLIEQKMQMLLRWRRKKGDRATVDQLMKHLVKLQQADLAEGVAEMLDIELDDVVINVAPEKNKSRTKHGVNSKRGRDNSKRGPVVAPVKTKQREYFSQSSGFSSENGYPSSPDDPPSRGGQGFRTSESSEGYQSSGSRKVKSRLRQTKDRPHVSISKTNPAHDVDIKKDQLPKRTSRLRQQQQYRSHDHQNGGSDPPSKFTRGNARFNSNGSSDSDLIVSEGGSDVAEESEIDEEDEIVTSTMLDCGDPAQASPGGPDTEECSSIEPTSPDSLVHQTVPKTVDDSYTLEHVNV